MTLGPLLCWPTAMNKVLPRRLLSSCFGTFRPSLRIDKRSLCTSTPTWLGVVNSPIKGRVQDKRAAAQQSL